MNIDSANVDIFELYIMRKTGISNGCITYGFYKIRGNYDSIKSHFISKYNEYIEVKTRDSEILELDFSDLQNSTIYRTNIVDIKDIIDPIISNSFEVISINEYVYRKGDMICLRMRENNEFHTLFIRMEQHLNLRKHTFISWIDNTPSVLNENLITLSPQSVICHDDSQTLYIHRVANARTKLNLNEKFKEKAMTLLGSIRAFNVTIDKEKLKISTMELVIKHSERYNNVFYFENREKINENMQYFVDDPYGEDGSSSWLVTNDNVCNVAKAFSRKELIDKVTNETKEMF